MCKFDLQIGLVARYCNTNYAIVVKLSILSEVVVCEYTMDL